MISFETVVKKYGAVTAVNGITLTIAQGDFCALLGPNGAGKTTMIKMLLDLIRPTSGTVSVNGIPSTDVNARASLGYLAENHALPGHLTGRQYLRRHAELSGMDMTGVSARIDEVIALVGMKEKAEAKAKTYSKGMIQRIGLAAAILHDPKLLVLDEPVNGLDPIGIREFREILETLKAKGVTLLLSSHLLSEAEKICTTVAIVNKGSIVLHDSVANLTKSGATLEDIFMKEVAHERA